MDIFKSLTIINSILLAILPLAFFRRQKLQEIKYKELMELNVKTHDITTRADQSLKEKHLIYQEDFKRLDYLISRYKKHSEKISEAIEDYKQTWEKAIENNKNATKQKTNKIIRVLLKKSESIRELADKLLS